MKKLNFFNIGRVVTLLFLSLFLSCHSIFAQDCPSLPQKTLELCNPSAEEVADALGAPVAIINGVRAVGEPDTENETFYQTIKDQEYQFKWNFKDGSGNVVATGCPQSFELQDNEAPTCGAATLNVHGYGLYASGNVVRSEIENQLVSWKDDCTPPDEIVFNFNEEQINTNKNYGDSRYADIKTPITINYTLTDKFGNVKGCEQNIKVEANSNYECPAIRKVYVNLNDCDITGDELKSIIYEEFPVSTNGKLPSMDGFGSDFPPTITADKVNIYSDDSGKTNFLSEYTPGEYKVYFHYYKTQQVIFFTSVIVDKYCPVSVIVKENSTPPACPNLEDIIIGDQTTVNADVLEANIKSKVSSYGEQLDNCTPNSNLDVVYTGSDLTAGFCGNVSYSLSDFGSMRSCVAKVVVLKCPELPQLKAEFCNGSSMSKTEMKDFLDANKPTLNYCSNNVVGSYNESQLSNTYSVGNKSINWIFTVSGVTKTCPQTINVAKNTSVSCASADLSFEAESGCGISGSKIPLPTVFVCYPLDVANSITWSRSGSEYKSFSTLSSQTFKDNDNVHWAINGAQCSTTIHVVDNTKPICSNPTIGKLVENNANRSDVEKLFSNKNEFGTDNCGIKEVSINWDQTGWSSFAPNGSEYDIYYTVTDDSDLQNDGFCIAKLKLLKSVPPCE